MIDSILFLSIRSSGTPIASQPPKQCAISPWGMRLSFRWSRPWASGSAHWPRTSSAVDGRFSWVSKGAAAPLWHTTLLAEFPRIVFHGLRHSSATYQLMISGGDIKAVQGTTGHASADMLVNTYAHIQQSSRVELGKKFENGFYAKPDTPSPQAVPAAGEPTISMTALLELLKDADPEMKAKLRLALLT